MSDLLPNEAERALYREIVQQGGRVMFREAMQQHPAATLRLIELGLLAHHTVDEALTAVNPRAAGGRIGARMRAEGAGLLLRAEEATALLEPLTQAYESARGQVDRSTVVRHVRDVEQIRHGILQVQSETREEILAAQPGGARPHRFLQQSLEITRQNLAAGVSLRTVYQPGAIADPVTTAYAAEVTELGERVRVLDEPFTRVLLFDRRAAIIPAAADNSSAAFVEDPAVVAVLVEGFERDWARAERVDWRALAGRPRRTGVPDELGALLAQGLTQRAIASRLGLSERTVAGHIARLREHHEAETLFQLGWLMREGAR
ncbi:LuxR C-terminal-related transcriptional regulator [Streptomyces sp. TLI_171]|uniref:LuxR C-terminal-related transcriptional regulator n=1 Tax=Streptomyces sp. TLI_171 TaxID=1938859 RepID=UPI000C17F5EC|nr:LuxR C-terminal-related transcriptional regulator [Streptomyces sp. TLI_171]RKE20199.1 regulatory LuxR family protein [Streptomyces sp. TLI_171]